MANFENWNQTPGSEVDLYAAPDVDVGFGKRGEHSRRDALAAGHLLAHGRQDAAAADLLHVADAARPDGVREPVVQCRSRCALE